MADPKEVLQQLQDNLNYLRIASDTNVGSSSAELPDEVAAYENAIKVTEGFLGGSLSEEEWNKRLKSLGIEIQADGVHFSSIKERTINIGNVAGHGTFQGDMVAGRDIKGTVTSEGTQGHQELNIPSFQQVADQPIQTPAMPEETQSEALLEDQDSDVHATPDVTEERAPDRGRVAETPRVTREDEEAGTTWGAQLRAKRESAGLSLQDFAKRLSEAGLYIPWREIDRYEQNTNIPINRERHIELIEALKRLGFIQDLADANKFLASANHGYLTEVEVKRIFSDETEREPVTEGDKGPTEASRTSLDITIRALSDAPTIHDLLGFTVYADALVKFIEDPRTEKPLTIAIDAPWGMGKSSLMRMIEQRLAHPGQAEDDNQEPDQISKKEKKGQPPAFPTIWFNAWQYDQSEAIWANLVLEILKQVRGRMNFWRRLGLTISLTRQRFDTEMLVQNIARYLLIYTLPILLIGLTLVGIAVLFLAPTMPEVLEQAQVYIAAVSWGALLSLIFAVGKEAYDKLTQPFSLKLEEYIRQPDYQDKAGFLTQFRDDFKRVVDVITKTKQGRWPLIIFIDDLDRCEPPRPVDIVEAINLLLDSKHCVFIIGMDSRTVAGSIEAKYKNMLAYLEQTGPSGSLTFGQQFLEKIVQVRFRIPRTDKGKFKAFIDKHLALDTEESPPGDSDAANEPEVRQAVALLKAAQREQPQPLDRAAQVVKDETALTTDVIDSAQARIKSDEALFDKNKAVQETISAAADYFNYNPRQVKRFINLYRLQTYIAQERKLLEHPGFQLDMLGELLILNMAWPRVTTALRRDQTFIERLEKAAELRRKLRNVPASEPRYKEWKDQFERYLEDGLITTSVDDDHLLSLLRKLKGADHIRQYLDLTELSLDPEAETGLESNEHAKIAEAEAPR